VSADVYEALVRLGEHELELIEAGALEDAAEVQLRRAAGFRGGRWSRR
jgi:hypothetical protein